MMRRWQGFMNGWRRRLVIVRMMRRWWGWRWRFVNRRRFMIVWWWVVIWIVIWRWRCMVGPHRTHHEGKYNCQHL